MKAKRVSQEREGWRSASIMPGALSVIVFSAQRMLQLLASNWEDSTERVNIIMCYQFQLGSTALTCVTFSIYLRTGFNCIV